MGPLRRKAIALAALAAAAAACAVAATRLLLPALLPLAPTPPAGAQGPAAPPPATDSDAGPSPDGGVATRADAGAPSPGASTASADGDGRRRAHHRASRDGADSSGAGRGSPHVIERERIEHLAEHPDKLGGASARLQRTPDGHVGFRLRGIRAGTPLHDAGLRSGDLLLSVNGLALTGGDAALEAFTRFVDGTRVRVVLLRGGAERRLRFRIE